MDLRFVSWPEKRPTAATLWQTGWKGEAQPDWGVRRPLCLPGEGGGLGQQHSRGCLPRGPEPPEEESQRGLCPGQSRGLGESPLLPCPPEKHPEPPCASPGSHSQEQPGILSTLSCSQEGGPTT